MNMALPSDKLPRFDHDAPVTPKDAQRQEIAAQIAEYLAKGGQIEQIPEGKQTDSERSFNQEDLRNYHKQRTAVMRQGQKHDN